MKSKRLAGFLALIVILAAIALYALWPSLASMAPVQDPTRYREVINRLREQGDTWVPQFPPAIPSAARNVRFSYEPGRGTLRMQLQYNLPPAEVADIVKRLQVPTTSPASAAQWPRFITLPPGFSRLVLGAGEENAGAGGHDFGIAVNVANHEVFYWTEEW